MPLKLTSVSSGVAPTAPWGALLLVLSLLAVGCTSPSPSPSPSTPGSSAPRREVAPPTTLRASTGHLVFGAPQAITSGTGLVTISCATPTACVALDANGRIYSYNGATWSGPVTAAPALIGPGAISVSCASPVLCAAIPTAASQVVTGAGQSWSPPETLTGATGLGAVGCAPTGYCAAVDAEGNAFSYSGGGWSSTSGDWGSAAGIACVSSDFCISVSGGISQWNGSSWTQPDSYAATGSFTAVTCPSVSFCMAAVNSGDVLAFNGQQWSTPVRVEPGQPSTTSIGPYPTGISCPSAFYCAAVDDAGAILQWSGTTWLYSKADPNHHLSAISCPTAAFCAAVDTSGNVILGRAA